jgi:hypothetical protein
MCLYPRIIKNKKYQANTKNGGNVPPLPLIEYNGIMIKDTRVLQVPVACGKCIECMNKKARDWRIRMLEEIKQDNKAEMVTLTFSNESIKKIGIKIPHLKGYERDNEIATIGMRLFLELWRSKTKKSVKHWAVTELGHNGTENIHMHAIIWSKDKEMIKKTWKHGFVYIGDYVNEKTVNYMIKYVHKQDLKHKTYQPKILCSKGLGKTYTETYNSNRNKFNKEKTIETYKNKQGHEMSLPIYYRNKIYNEKEREKLWINKLERNERFIMGIKINMNEKKGIEIYRKLLKEAQLKNKRLGYGDNQKNWQLKEYEESIRNIRYAQRIGEEIKTTEKMEIIPKMDWNTQQIW